MRDRLIPSRLLPASLAQDLPASFVVFLVALPLCMGIPLRPAYRPSAA